MTTTARRSWWSDFRKAPAEPWSWWFTRHQVKVFGVGLVMVVWT